MGLLVLTPCHRPHRPAVIGFALSLPHPNVSDVAREALRERADVDRLPVLISEDTISTPHEGTGAAEVSRALRLVATPGLVGVVGHAGSGYTLLVAPVYSEAGVPLVVPNSTSRRLRAAGPWVFPLAPDDSIEGAFIAAFLSDRLRLHSVTVFYSGDAYGTGLRDGVLAGLRGRPVTVTDQVSFTSAYGGWSTSTARMTPLVAASLRRGAPDGVVIIGQAPDAAAIMGLVHVSRPSIWYVVGDGAWPDSMLMKQAGPAVDSAYFATFWQLGRGDSASRAFVHRFQRIVGRPPNHADALAYDAIMLLVAAAREVGTDRRRIRRYLGELGATRPAFPGLTRPIAFSDGLSLGLAMVRSTGEDVTPEGLRW